MAASAAESRARPADYLQLVFYRAAELVLGLVPLALCHALGAGLGTAAWAASRRYRRLVARNLRIAGGIDGADPALPRLVRRSFALAGANLACGLRTATMPLDRLRRHLEIDGAELLAKVNERGVGVLGVLSHMGNWEVQAQATWLLVPDGTEVGAVYRPLDNPLIDRLVRRRRADKGSSLFSRRDGFHAVTNFLRDGHVIGVLSDQRAGHKGVLAPFFGRLSSCSGLPELLARRTGAIVATASVTTVGAGRWRLRYRVVEDTTTAGVMEALAESMSDSLPDVFWLHDRWRVDPLRPLEFRAKRPVVQGIERVAKPFRLLVSCRGLDEAAAAAIDEILAARSDVRIELLDDGATAADSPRVRRPGIGPDPSPRRLARQLVALDRDGPAPLDAAILLDGDRQLAQACRRAGLRAVLGVTADPAGAPWSRTLPPPRTADGWRELARSFGAVPILPEQ